MTVSHTFLADDFFGLMLTFLVAVLAGALPERAGDVVLGAVLMVVGFM